MNSINKFIALVANESFSFSLHVFFISSLSLSASINLISNLLTVSLRKTVYLNFSDVCNLLLLPEF